MDAAACGGHPEPRRDRAAARPAWSASARAVAQEAFQSKNPCGTMRTPSRPVKLLAPSGARQGAQGRPRHRRPLFLMKGFALHPFEEGKRGSSPINCNFQKRSGRSRGRPKGKQDYSYTMSNALNWMVEVPLCLMSRSSAELCSMVMVNLSSFFVKVKPVSSFSKLSM